MFSIPFFTGHFVENSRYSPIGLNYVRYVGTLIIFAAGGLVYLIFKQNKTFSEWTFLLPIIFLTLFIYQQTYMKWFLPIFVIPLGCIGLINVVNLSRSRKFILKLFVVYLLLFISFSGYYQFLHFNQESNQEDAYDARYIEESTYISGKWMKNNIDGIAISNDILLGERIFSVSETAHLFTDRTTLNQIYGFTSINISDFKRYSLTEEDFWYAGYDGPDVGEKEWFKIHEMSNPPSKYNISYIVENKNAIGTLVWNHGNPHSKLLDPTYENNLVYDSNIIRIWELR
jgi:hypothetical protein